MKNLLNKLKTFAIGILLISFFMATAVSSCTSPKKGEEETDGTEVKASEKSKEGEGSEEAEHPSGGEHPSDADSVETSDHPADSEEHPSDN